MIYWANGIYKPFFPDWFYRWFDLDHRLAEGMAIHFTVGWLFCINGAIYLLTTFVSGHWRELAPDRSTARNAGPYLLYDLHLSQRKPPQGKFNAVQQFVYTGVGLLGVTGVLSGFAIYKPVQLRWLTSLFFGYEGARLTHFTVMILLCAFFILHLIQVARAGWSNFRSMITGYEETP